MGYVGHWALYEGLSDVERVLLDVERGSATPLPARVSTDGYFSYFPASRLLRIWRRRAARGLPWAVTELTPAMPRTDTRSSSCAQQMGRDTR